MSIQLSTSNIVSVDLMKAWHRSDSKLDEWDENVAQNAIVRYKKFLLLIADNPQRPFAPTRDIDEIWHLHMLSPRAYYEDCQRLFGEVLDHDGGFGKGDGEMHALLKVFDSTSALWKNKYQEEYTSGATDEAQTKCWHDCVGRCWHACSNNITNN